MKTNNKVICIDDDFTDVILKVGSEQFLKDFQKLPIKDEYYTILQARALGNGTYGLILNEIRNKHIYFINLNGYAEPAFNSKRFRVVDENDMIIKESITDVNKKQELVLN